MKILKMRFWWEFNFFIFENVFSEKRYPDCILFDFLYLGGMDDASSAYRPKLLKCEFWGVASGV